MAEQQQSECRCFDGLFFSTSPSGSPTRSPSAVDDVTSSMQKLVVVGGFRGGAKSKTRKAVSKREDRREKRRLKRDEERKIAASNLPDVPDMLCVDERGGAVMKISHPGIHHPRPQNVGLKCLRQAVDEYEKGSPRAEWMTTPPRLITRINPRPTITNPRRDSRCPTYGIIGGDVLVIELSDAEEFYGPLPDPKSM